MRPMRPMRPLIPLLTLVVLCAASARPAPAAGPQNMRQIQTRHYRIHTDLDFELANDLANRLDAMYEAYSWRLRLFNEAGRPLPRFEVYLYTNSNDYLALTGQRMKHTGGVVMSGRNLLAAFLE